MQIVQEVYGDHAHLEREVNVVFERAFVVQLSQIVNVTQVNYVASYHVQCSKSQAERLLRGKKNMIIFCLKFV